LIDTAVDNGRRTRRREAAEIAIISGFITITVRKPVRPLVGKRRRVQEAAARQ
jgi:hypothetical protein